MIAHTEHRLPTSKSLRLVQIALELGDTPRTLVSEAGSEKRYCLHCMYRVAAHDRIRISNRSCVNSRRLDVDVACLSRNLATFRVHMLHASVQLNFRRPPWKHELSRVMNYFIATKTSVEAPEVWTRTSNSRGTTVPLRPPTSGSWQTSMLHCSWLLQATSGKSVARSDKRLG